MTQPADQLDRRRLGFALLPTRERMRAIRRLSAAGLSAETISDETGVGLDIVLAVLFPIATIPGV